MTTVLSETDVLDTVKAGLSWRGTEKNRLDRIHQYLRDPDVSQGSFTLGSGMGPLRWLAKDVTPTVRRLAEMSRVNMLKFVVDATVQVMYVDGYRAPKADTEEPAWETWQKNRMDARQIGLHRAALSYGVAYATVLPGDTAPVIRGASPRRMTAVYGDDEDWPEYALEQRRHPRPGFKLWRMYDAEAVWWIEENEHGVLSIERPKQLHHAGTCPVVRFISSYDDDGEVTGEVEPLIPIQDQINVTTFGLMVAQHYGAFRQRYIMGWTAPSEGAALVASAKKLWSFEDPEVKVGEFAQTDLSGYINSREASLRHLATISQTPAHELLGQLVNLSADALVAAERNHRAKVVERQTTFGEAWEQVLTLAAEENGDTSDEEAYVRWRDTEARSLSQVADALGKLVVSLGVPAQELWERIPGVTQQEVERWKSVADDASQNDPLKQLAAELKAQNIYDKVALAAGGKLPGELSSGGAGGPANSGPPAAPPKK